MSHDDQPLLTIPASPTSSFRGLFDAADLLEAAGVCFWIDSGVLLGLFRSGGLLLWEKDIDLGIWSEDLSRLVACEQQFRKAGYQISFLNFRQIPYAVSLKPAAESGRLPVAIHVFYRREKIVWSPQAQLYMPSPAPDISAGEAPGPFGRIVRKFITRRQAWNSLSGGRNGLVQSHVDQMMRFIWRRADKGFLATTWPFSEIVAAFTWAIPLRLLHPLGAIRIGGRRFLVPGRPEDYLRFRYGDWRTPKKEWYYWRDDGAIRRGPPEIVLRAVLSLPELHPGSQPIGDAMATPAEQRQ